MNQAKDGELTYSDETRPRDFLENDTWIDADGNLRSIAAPLTPLIDFVAGIKSSVHVKLVGGFFIGTLLLLGLFIISAIVVDRMSRQVNELNRVQAKVDLARQMKHLVTEQSHLVATALLTNNEVIGDDIEDAREKFSEQLNTLAMLSPQEAKELEVIREINGRLGETNDKVLALYNEGKIEEATNLYFAAEYPVSRELDGALSQLINDNTRDMASSIAGFRSHQGKFEVIIVGFSLVSLIVVLVVGFVLSWSFIRPVWKIDNVLAKVSKGDFSHSVEVPNRDEFGTLGDNINAMSGELQRLYDELKNELSERMNLTQALAHRTQELAAANQELESFSYSVSHDLRAPLRSMDGFSQALMDDYADSLDEEARDYLRRIGAASQRMGELIDDLLMLSRVTRAEISRERVDLTELARSIAEELRDASPERNVTFDCSDNLVASGDPHLLHVMLENLIGNAWKYTGRRDDPKVEFGVEEREDGAVFYVRDNGAGFDTAYVDKLFNPFQRLHPSSEFEGTGIGLATVRRIINRHGGQVWAEGEVNVGATFYFTLG